MPLSTNAPFNEFGQSMILRDIEQLYLSLNGVGTGAAGEGSTQDQSVQLDQSTGDSGGLPDLSGLATIDYVDQVANDLLDSIPTVSYPISVANGGTGATTEIAARLALGVPGETLVLKTSGSTWTVPAGVNRILVFFVGGGGGGAGSQTTGAALFADYSGNDVYYRYNGSAGGAGGVAIATIQVTPGETINYTIGSGGSAGANNAFTPTGGSVGGSTYITIGGKTIGATGGDGGRNDYTGGVAYPIQGGYGYIQSGFTRASVIHSASRQYHYAPKFHLVPYAGLSLEPYQVGPLAQNISDGSVFSTSYGQGGNGGESLSPLAPTAGVAGCIAFIY